MKKNHDEENENKNDDTDVNLINNDSKLIINIPSDVMAIPFALFDNFLSYNL